MDFFANTWRLDKICQLCHTFESTSALDAWSNLAIGIEQPSEIKSRIYVTLWSRTVVIHVHSKAILACAALWQAASCLPSGLRALASCDAWALLARLHPPTPTAGYSHICSAGLTATTAGLRMPPWALAGRPQREPPPPAGWPGPGPGQAGSPPGWDRGLGSTLSWWPVGQEVGFLVASSWSGSHGREEVGDRQPWAAAPHRQPPPLVPPIPPLSTQRT